MRKNIPDREFVLVLGTENFVPGAVERVEGVSMEKVFI